MKHLHDIVLESLLDDFDVISNQTDNDIINKSINDKEGQLWSFFDLDRREIGSRFPLKYEDGTLYIPRSLVQQRQGIKKLETVVGFHVDNLVVAGGLNLGLHQIIDELTGDNFCKKISCGAGVKIRSRVVKNIEISAGDIYPYKNLVSSINTISFEDIELLENVKFKLNAKWPSISFHQYDTLPKIKNCDLKGCKSISIYSPFLFEKEISELITSKWMLPNFEHNYNRGEVVKIKNFKKMVAIVNNPKKYGDYVPKAFKDDIYASDVISWINDIDPALEQVTLHTNNVRLTLMKGPKNNLPSNKFSFVTYTKDGWNITMYKK